MLVSELYDLYLPLLFNSSLELHQINGVGFCNPFQAIVGDFSLLEYSQNVEAFNFEFLTINILLEKSFSRMHHEFAFNLERHVSIIHKC